MIDALNSSFTTYNANFSIQLIFYFLLSNRTWMAAACHRIHIILANVQD